MTEHCCCETYEMRKACVRYDECLVDGKLRDLFQKQSGDRITLIYDVQIGAYRIPSIVDRSKFTVLNAYCEITRND